jgi:hypothetical protein
MNTYPDQDLMDAYDRWCETDDWFVPEPDHDEAEPDHDEASCVDCGRYENLNDCGDSGIICDDCGADRYELLREPR